MAATDKETIILDLKVDQGSAISELERTKKSIVQLKEEQQQLTKAYKAGEIAVDEYASESVRLEAILKKNQAEYNNIQKSVTGVKTQMDKLIDSNKKISAEFQNAANNIRVAGVSVGDLTTKLTAFANPAVAAVGVVTALGAAYSRSTIGAKDLEFASNQLSNAITLITNDFANLISSAEDGEGLFSKLTNSLINAFSPALAAQSKALAIAQEQLEDSNRNELILRQQVNERLENNQELMTKIQDSQTDINEKTHLVTEIISNLRANEEDLLKTKNDQLKALNAQLAGDQKNEKLQDLVAIKTGEISAIKKDTERKVQSILKLESNLLDTENKKTDAIKKQNEERRKSEAFAASEAARNKRIEDLDKSLQGPDDPFGTEAFKNTKVGVDNLDDLMRQSAATQKEIRDQDTADYIANQELKFATTAAYTSALTTLAITAFGENSAIAKATGIADAIVNTYTGATLALRSAPPPLSFALAALTIANGLASVAQISRAAGGGDFVTRGPALMMVGDNPGGRERVTVEPLSGRGRTHVAGNMVAMAGGGSLTTGFDDGGITKNGAVAQMDQVLMLSNTMKNLPNPVVGVEEFTRVAERVRVKQSVAKA